MECDPRAASKVPLRIYFVLQGVRLNSIVSLPHAARSAPKPPGLVTLIEAVTAGAEIGLTAVASLEVHLPGGARMLLAHPGHLALAAVPIRQLQAAPQPG